MAKPSLQLAKFASIAAAATAPQGDYKVDIDKILVGVQIRKKFKNLEELAASIQDIGIAEPLIVRPNDDGTFHLIAGERRLRAARLAGLTQVPIVVRQGTDALTTRKLQIAENNERDDLTPYEEALGVLEDVDQYGVKGAVEIWKRSESWISKRTAVQKYGPITKAILEKGLTGDFEVLHALSQIEAIDVEEVRRLGALLEAGPGSLSRAEVRNCLERIKLRRAQERERVRVQSTKAQPVAVGKKVAQPESTKAGDEEQRPKQRVVRHSGTSDTPHGASSVHDQAIGEVPGQVEADEALIQLRREILAAGQQAGNLANQVIHELQAQRAEVDAGEWILWSSFQDALLPLAAVLGDKRMEQYLKRMGLELKRKDPQTILTEMHGDSINKPTSASLPPMPEGWRF